MKIILCVVIVFCSGYVGISLANDYNKKIAIISDFNSFFHFLKVKIAFSKDILANCIEEFINQNIKNKKVFLELKDLIINSSFNKENIQRILPEYLTITDKEMFINMLLNIGTTDEFSQIQIIENNINLLSIKENEYKLLKKTKGDVYSKLSICIGLVICILIY